MRWPWQRDPYLTKAGSLRIPYGVKGIIVMPEVDTSNVDVRDIAPGEWPAPRDPTQRD